MWLSGEDGEPEVEWAYENQSAESRGEGLAGEEFEEDEEGEGEEGEGEEDVEVEEEVADIEVPWLGAVDVRAFVGGAEDVVEDDVEGDEGGEAVEG